MSFPRILRPVRRCGFLPGDGGKARRAPGDGAAGLAQQVRALEQELEGLARSISHDLAAPLRQVEGFLDLLQSHLGPRLAPEETRYLDAALRASGRMQAQLEALSGYARLGRADLCPMDLDSGPQVWAVIEGLRPSWEKRQIRWVVGPLPRLHADPVLLRTLLQHLLDNALKATRGREEAVIEVVGRDATPGSTGLAIRDNGLGFRPESGHKLFQLFQKLHRDDQFEGLGVGLACVRRIVTRHGGTVWAEGSPDGGATFGFTLPCPEGPR